MFDLIKQSFFYQNWELFAVFIAIIFIISKFTQNRESISEPKISDEQRIANDYQEDEVNEDDLSPSLEIEEEHIPFSGATKILKGGADEFYEMANDRRSVRSFTSEPVDIEIIKKCIHAAGTSPSGAHTEPWTFCLIKR
jgi:iodotyrosine deiodinase